MKELIKCVLFKGLDEKEIELLLKQNSIKKKYTKNGYIARINTPAKYIGIILKGGANIISDDYWGNKNIVSCVSKGEIFMESFALLDIQEIPLSIVATEDSEVAFIDHRIILNKEAKNSLEIKFIDNLMTLIANKNVLLTQKIFLLSQRNSRNKILSYLSYVSNAKKSDYFEIPFDRQELADYLCLDRSALSKELGKMKAEGLLDFDKNTFKLRK